MHNKTARENDIIYWWEETSPGLWLLQVQKDNAVPTKKGLLLCTSTGGVTLFIWDGVCWNELTTEYDGIMEGKEVLERLLV